MLNFNLKRLGLISAPYVTLLCFLVAAMSLTQGGYLLLKAHMAQYLLENAWQHTVIHAPHTNNQHKPWPWADIYPIAKLSFDRFNMTQIVLNNDSGQALAFGPGLYQGDMINDESLTANAYVISAHNDTHFAILERLSLNDSVTMTLPSGISQTFAVDNISIINTQTEQLVLLNEATQQRPTKDRKQGIKELVLVTCYPFDSLSQQASLRYVLHLSLISN